MKLFISRTHNEMIKLDNIINRIFTVSCVLVAWNRPILSESIFDFITTDILYLYDLVLCDLSISIFFLIDDLIIRRTATFES